MAEIATSVWAPEIARTVLSAGAFPRNGVGFDAVTVRIAAGQHGVVTRRQLLEAGVSPKVVDRRIAAGRLRPMHRGIYAVGPILPPRAAEMAAALACGPTALVSHVCAAALWELEPSRGRGEPVEVTTVGHARRQPGIRIHRTAHLTDGDRAVVEAIPVTSPARTLYDLASTRRARHLERALARAVERGLTTTHEMAALLDRLPGRRGAQLLRAILDHDRPLPTRSEAEVHFLAMVRSARLPAPEPNVRLGRYEVDFYWPKLRVVAEIDGFGFHSSKAAFERDHERDAYMAARGIRVFRVTWRQLTRERDVTLAQLAQILGPA